MGCNWRFNVNKVWQGEQEMSHARSLKSLGLKLAPIFGAPPKEIVTKENLTKARELQEFSEEAAPIVLPYAQFIAREIGLDPNDSIIMGPKKTLPRIFSKAIGKFGGDVTSVPDIGRLRELVEDPRHIRELRYMYLGSHPRYERNEGSNEKEERVGKVLDRHPTNEITIREFEDFFWIPSKTGRPAIHLALDVKLSSTRIVPYEIQIIHKGMVDTEDFTHDNYQKLSEIRNTAIREKRSLTPNEAGAIEMYQESNKNRYEADALNYDLIGLRHPTLRHELNQRHLMAVNL